MNQRIWEGNELADALIGLTGNEASAVASENGFRPEVIRPGWLVAADPDPQRIMLVLDDSGLVTRAWGG